jgi:hypothetical protein
MKRLALLLAAVSVLGTGCYVAPSSPPTGSIDMAWRFIRVKPSGSTVAYGCASGGGVDSVAVTIGGASQVVPCQDNVGDGGLFVGVPAGNQSVVVTGRRGGVDIYSSQFTIAVVAGTTTPVNLDVYGIPDDIDILAELVTRFGSSPYTSCNQAVVSGFTYSIHDSAGTVMESGSAGCTTGLPDLLFRGSSALDRDTYTIRMQAPASGPVVFDTATTAVAPTCSGQAFNHTGVDTGANAWVPLMYDTTANPTVCQ